jgi:8-oxo-dGTP pyrophosphatase MutT (NUDIX family)
MSAFSGMIYQAAAIPVRNGKVCVVKSSSGKRWVIPKGCLESGKSRGDIALQEAWEEAGLVGILNPEPVGSYLYDKWENTYHVTVYLMEVTEVAEEYPESMLRERLWLEPNRALARINDRGLRAVLRKALKEDRIHIEA